MNCIKCTHTEFDMKYLGKAGSGMVCLSCGSIKHHRVKYTPRLPTGMFWTDSKFQVISKVIELEKVTVKRGERKGKNTCV